MKTIMTFDDLFHSFSGLGLLVSPSEIHGLVCSRIVTGEQLDEEGLIEVVNRYADSDQVGNLESELYQLYQVSARQLSGDGVDFLLLLPDDDSPLGQRTQSLAEWCQGFMYGLGESGLNAKTSLSEDAMETLGDFAAISQLRDEDADEDDEMNFFELAEFVRIGVLMLFIEMGGSGARQSSPTIH